jgi:hypothetical protein
MGEHFSLYVAPINLDPESPAMPISHPPYYATYLAKKVGAYSTLGLAEDTWALNEGVTDDQTFLKQAYDIDREREAMFFARSTAAHRHARLRVRRHGSHPAHVLARHRSGPPGGRAASGAGTGTPSASCTSTTTRWSGACARS